MKKEYHISERIKIKVIQKPKVFDNFPIISKCLKCKQDIMQGTEGGYVMNENDTEVKGMLCKECSYKSFTKMFGLDKKSL